MPTAPKTPKISRRQILGGAALTLGGACACQCAGAASTCCSTPQLEADSLQMTEHSLTIDLAKAPSLGNVGDAVNIIDAQRKIDLIIVRAGEAHYAALSGLCTHAPRPLSYQRPRRVLQCNNFGHSIFDLTGQVLKGPAEKPLRTFAVTMRADKLEIALDGGEAIVWNNPKDGMPFVRIPAGGPAPKGLWMGQTEVTVAQFRRFVQETKYVTSAEAAGAENHWRSPGFTQTGDHPVVYMSKQDALRYTQWAGVDLPTEAEWDYAARAGTKTLFYWGDEVDDRYVWHRGNSPDGTSPVAAKRPNAWGLYDMLGNAWEWCRIAPAKGPACTGLAATPHGGAWTRCPEYTLHDGRVLHGLAASLPAPLQNCDALQGLPWDDDRGFRCVRYMNP